ncbi:MAG: hypothetical protein MUW55_07045 [Pantoea vagans]|nr:hypothetical protein [Pantoea vagans]
MPNGRVVVQFECNIQYIGDAEQFSLSILEIWFFIMKSSFELLLNEGTKKIDDAINRHERNEVAPLSFQALMQVKKELKEMKRVMDPKMYMPGYPRFILDWPDEDGLIDELINISYLYGKIRKS